MFNLIAQYIGYGADTELEENKGNQDPRFGVVEEGEWTLVDMVDADDINDTRGNAAEDGYQYVDTPEQLNNVEWPMTESTSSRVRDLPSPQQAVSVDRRLKCAKSKKSRRVTPNLFPQYRPNQLKRYNQAFCQRSSKVNQKMRQIVHQPRKF